MRSPALSAAIVLALSFTAACHPGPILNTGTEVQAGGTIAGLVQATGGTVPIAGRKVTVTNVATNVQYSATTADNGGYTIKVPEGTYRIEVELRPGETLAKRPDETQVNNGDLDPGRDFEITAAGTR